MVSEGCHCGHGCPDIDGSARRSAVEVVGEEVRGRCGKPELKPAEENSGANSVLRASASATGKNAGSLSIGVEISFPVQSRETGRRSRSLSTLIPLRHQMPNRVVKKIHLSIKECVLKKQWLDNSSGLLSTSIIGEYRA